MTQANVEIASKRLQLLHEIIPTASVVALLLNPANKANAEPLSREVQAAARTFGLKLHVLHASGENDFDGVFATIIELRAGGLMIAADPYFTSRSEQLGELTLRHAVPAVYQRREFAAAGGLMSYGADITDAYRQPAAIPAVFSRATNPPICRFSSQPRSNWSSTSRPPRHSASPSPTRSSGAPTR